MGLFPMAIKLVLALLFIASCGREVNLKENKLESTQKISDADVKRYQKTGTISKTSSGSTILFEGRNYKVSIYSSKIAQDFVAALSNGSQVPVVFTGGVSGTDVVIETIQRQ
jgi:hypothetical protein